MKGCIVNAVGNHILDSECGDSIGLGEEFVGFFQFKADYDSSFFL